MIVETVDGTTWIIRDDKNKYNGLILRRTDGEFVGVREGKVITRTNDYQEAVKAFGD